MLQRLIQGWQRGGGVKLVAKYIFNDARGLVVVRGMSQLDASVFTHDVLIHTAACTKNQRFLY